MSRFLNLEAGYTASFRSNSSQTFWRIDEFPPLLGEWFDASSYNMCFPLDSEYLRCHMKMLFKLFSLFSRSALTLWSFGWLFSLYRNHPCRGHMYCSDHNMLPKSPRRRWWSSLNEQPVENTAPSWFRNNWLYYVYFV